MVWDNVRPGCFHSFCLQPSLLLGIPKSHVSGNDWQIGLQVSNGLFRQWGFLWLGGLVIKFWWTDLASKINRTFWHWTVLTFATVWVSVTWLSEQGHCLDSIVFMALLQSMALAAPRQLLAAPRTALAPRQLCGPCTAWGSWAAWSSWEAMCSWPCCKAWPWRPPHDLALAAPCDLAAPARLSGPCCQLQSDLVCTCQVC